VTLWRVEPLAGEADVEGVMAVERASFTNPWTRDMYLAELEHVAIAHFLVLRAREGSIGGFCSYWVVADELHVNNLAIHPDLRRQGAASALLRAVLADGVARGAATALLEVRRSNEAARQLYQRFGFQLAATRRSYYSNPVEDALVLARRDLRGPEPGRPSPA
jgi:ribosomal-protein-alanine N-acetyltransferase